MKKSGITIKLSTIKNMIGGFFLFVLFTLMIGHTVNTSWIQSYFPNGTILILISSIIVFIFFGRKKSSNINWKISLPYFFFFIIAIFYALIDGSIEEIEKIIYIILSSILLIRSSLNYSDIIKIGLIICASSIYAASGYKSFEINSLGIVFSFGIVALINFIDFYFIKDKEIIFIILAILSLIIISLTKMRGAILSITIVFLFTIFKELNTNKKRIIALIIIPIVLLFFWNDFSSFFKDYLFVNKWGGSDITAGRLKIWNYIFYNSGLFGIGFNYISGYAHAHNTLIHFIGRYGFIIIPLYIYVIYVIIYKICKISQNDIIKKICLRFFILWFVFSITETIDFVKVSLYIPQFLLLLYLAVLSRKELPNENKKYN